MTDIPLPAGLLDWLVPLLLIYARIQACLMPSPPTAKRVLPAGARVPAAVRWCRFTQRRPRPCPRPRLWPWRR